MVSSNPLHRQRLFEALSTPTQLLALVGPIGAGATTLLRRWATQYPHAAWGAAGSIPDDPGELLVIDNADKLSEFDWTRIGKLLEVFPRLRIRVAVHSRRAIPVALEAEFVTGLSLTLHETAAYLSELSSNLDADAVYLAAGGLPAAVRAIARLKTTDATLVAEALATLRPGALKAESAALAVPEMLTQALVTELGGPPEFIDEAERAGLGEWRPDAGRPLFVLTAPVRAATITAHPTEDSMAIRQSAAQVLLAQGAWYGALVEGAAAKSLPVIDAALKGGGMQLLQMHGAAIAASLRDIRVLTMRHWPIIALALALVYNARHEHRVRAAELLGIALLGARTAAAGSTERAILHVAESVARRLLGIGDGGVKAARAASRILVELPPDEMSLLQGILGDLHTHSAISLLYGGHSAEAIAEFERVIATAARPSPTLIAFGGIAVINALAGDCIAAQRWVDTALARPWSETILNEYPGSLLRIAQAKIYVERGQLDQAEAAIDAIWPIIDTIEHWPLLAHLRGLIDICRGRPGEGQEQLRALRRRRGTRMPRSQARLLDMTESSLALAAGELSSAIALTAHPGDPTVVTIGVAKAEIFDGQHERALRRLVSIGSDEPEARASIAVLEAIGLRRLGLPTEAAAAARRARIVADAHGLTTPFLLVPPEDREIFGPRVPWQAHAVSAGARAPRLTERERVILLALVDTANMSEIAQRLHVSVNTVKSQRRTLYRKLGATSRDEALAIALGHRLLAQAPR